MKTKCFLAFFVLIFLVACGAQGTVLDYKRELSALTMRVGVSGSFFLASGSFGSNPIYIFVETDDSGMSAVKSVPITYGVYVKDIQEGSTPFVEYYTCEYADGTGSNCLGVEGVPEVISNTYISYYYVFHIPQGTLATSYDLGFTPPQP